MSQRNAAARRSAAAVLVAILLLATGAQPLAGATGHISGTLTFREKIALSGNAVAVVSLVDIVGGAAAGVTVGQQRIDGLGEVPLPFSVPFDIRRIDPKHPYALFAALIDGPRSWQNPQGIAVLTGGPTSGVDAILPLSPEPAATIVGTITATGLTTLSSKVVAVASLIKKETGTVVNRQVSVVPGPAPIAFSIGFDPTVIDPWATYLVKAAVVDGGRIWENRTGVVAIIRGRAQPRVAVPLPSAPASLSVALPAPGTTAPSTAPSGAPSGAAPSGSGAAPSGSTGPTSSVPLPSGSATVPSPPPSLVPSPATTPTPTPTATSTSRPSSSEGPTGAASIPPGTGLITGTLGYPEPHPLSADAVAAVVLVQGSAEPDQNPIVASQIVRAPDSRPVAFRLVYDATLIDPNATYSVQAEIVDGAHAWATGRGTVVIPKTGSAARIELVLSYRPDLVKGEVTGSLTGADITPTEAAYAVAVLTDPPTGQSLGMDLLPTVGSIPVPFSIPFALSGIDPATDYLVGAQIVDPDWTWQNQAGVPVISRGNPISDVQVVVALAAAAAPSPTPSPSLGQAPPAPSGDIGSGIVVLVLALITGAAGIVLYDRSRLDPGRPLQPAVTDSEADLAGASSDDLTASSDQPPVSESDSNTSPGDPEIPRPPTA
ncbi:MAG: YbaY family lipoprotein [Chloroflexota bacterium]